MSTSQDFSGSRRSGGKLPEKSNFAQTCNLLSQYIKERGCLRDISLEIAGKLEPKGKPVEISKQALKFGSSTTIEDVINNKPNSSKSAMMEPKKAQMTIFYGGQVLVFDDFPANKAQEVMLWASNGSSSCVASGSNIAIPNSGSTIAQSQSQANNSDMPIARKSSIHRFLEKRKDRVTTRAPYQLQKPCSAFPKHEEQLQLKL